MLTASHCVASFNAGSLFLWDKVRVRIPILEKWDDPKDNIGVNPRDIFHDYQFDLVDNVNVFIYPLHRDRGQMSCATDVALVRIPPHSYKPGLPFKCIRIDEPHNECCVVGFPATVKSYCTSIILIQLLILNQIEYTQVFFYL